MWLGNASRTVAIPLPATTYTWNVYKGNVMAKLTDKQWLDVKALYECGHGVTELSKRFNTPKSTLQSRVKKECWQQGRIQSLPNFDIEEHFASIKENAEDSQDVKSLRLILAIREQEFKIEQSKTDQLRTICNAKPIQFERIDKHINNSRGVREKSALDTIEQLLGIKLIRQFQVGGFRIDGYDVDNKIAYEIDEDQHRSIKHSQHDVLRQKFIEDQLGCTFKRIKV